MSRVYYAIGDVHGMDNMLEKMHDAILQDSYGADETVIVHLGDYVDRGPASAQVVNRIRTLEQDCMIPGMSPGIRIVSLMGNHEDLMVKAYRDANMSNVRLWLGNGGDATLDSYEAATQFDIPIHDIEWMEKLPSYHKDEENKILFVHAGIDYSDFPTMHHETNIWTRSFTFFNDDMWEENPALDGWLVVHGHTPHTTSGEWTPRRINVDTGAVFKDMGVLTAAVITIDDGVRYEKHAITVDRELNVRKF